MNAKERCGKKMTEKIREICPHCKKECGKRHLVDSFVVCWNCNKMSKLEDWCDQKN